MRRKDSITAVFVQSNIVPESISVVSGGCVTFVVGGVVSGGASVFSVKFTSYLGVGMNPAVVVITVEFVM